MRHTPQHSDASKIPPLGAHMSIAGGFALAVDRARQIGATALQIFLKNSNQWRAREIPPEEAELFHDQVRQSDLAPPVAHSSYLINLASPAPDTALQSAQALMDELARAQLLGIVGVILHPGAHMKQGEPEGLRKIAEQLNQVLDATKGNPTAVYLETTAGQGSCLGYRFEQLAEIIAMVEEKPRVAVCLDTCHVFAAGYDLRTRQGVEATLKQFDETIGLGQLRVIHANDSQKPLGSRRDRHEHIGRGEIGEVGFACLLQDPRLRHIPFILETPKEEGLEEDRMNLATLRRLASEDLA